MSYFQNLWKNRHIILALVQKDLVVQYRRSFLGVLWAVLMPLGVTLIIAFIYSTLWSQEITYFVPYLFSGLTPWTFLVEACRGGAMSYISAEGYIKQLPIDLEIFPTRTTLTAMVNLLMGLVAYVIVLLILSPRYLTVWSLMTFPALLVFFLLGLSLATIAATAQTYVRDFDPLQSLLLQGLFYITPILYDFNMIRARGMSFVYQYNPFFYFIQILREALMGQAPNGQLWLIALGILAVVLSFAVWLFLRTKRKIAFKL